MEFTLIIKKVNNSLSEKEQKLFQEWYNESAEHRKYFSRVQDNYNKELDCIDLEREWKELFQKIESKKKHFLRFSWQYVAAVAAAIIALLIIPFLLHNNRGQQQPIIAKNTLEILPGTDKAVLTLENGNQVAIEKNQKIELPNGKVQGTHLVYDKDVDESLKNLKYNYITVPKGGEFYVELADGTKVWLNSETKFKYPVRFAKNHPREVELVYGEAYFDVSPASANSGTEFKVYTAMQQINVLGTEFNVHAYKEEAVIATTLVEGKVHVSDGVVGKVLAPSEQSRYNKKTQRMIVAKVDTYNEISWKRGEFSFKNKPLSEIIQVLSRWYAIEIVIINDDLKETTFTGVLSKDQKLTNILNIIRKTTPLDYTMRNGKVLLK